MSSNNRQNNTRAGPNLNKDLPDLPNLPAGQIPTAHGMHPRHRADAAPRRRPDPVDSVRAQATYVGPYVPVPNEAKINAEYNIYLNTTPDRRPHAVFTSAPTTPESSRPGLKKVGSFSSLKSLKSPVSWMKGILSPSKSKKPSSRKSSISFEKPITAPRMTSEQRKATLRELHGTSETVEDALQEACRLSKASPLARRFRLQEGSPPFPSEAEWVAGHRRRQAQTRDNQWMKYIQGGEGAEEAFNLWNKSVLKFLPLERLELYQRAKSGHEIAAQQWAKILHLEAARDEQKRNEEAAIAKKRADDKAAILQERKKSPTNSSSSKMESLIEKTSSIGLCDPPGRMDFSDCAPPDSMEACISCGRPTEGILRRGKCYSCR